MSGNPTYQELADGCVRAASDLESLDFHDSAKTSWLSIPGDLVADLIRLCVSAWNGTFGGTADIYEAIGDLEEAAAQLRGFPRNPSDRREIVFGTFDRKCAGGGINMRFHCIGGAGHSYVEATIDSNCESAGTVQTAVLSMPVEAAAVDVFVQELQRVGANRAGTAFLKGLE